MEKTYRDNSEYVNKPVADYTMSLALFDAVPVAMFIANSLIINSCFRSKLFLIGSASSAIAGATKVARKINLVRNKRDIELIKGWFKPLMISGFSLMTVAVLKEAASGSFVRTIKRADPKAFGLFMAGSAGYVLMGYLGRHLDNSARSNWIEEITNTAAQGAIMAGLLVG